METVTSSVLCYTASMFWFGFNRRVEVKHSFFISKGSIQIFKYTTTVGVFYLHTR